MTERHIIIIDECNYGRMGFSTLIKQGLISQRGTKMTFANNLTDVSEIARGYIPTPSTQFDLLLRLPASPAESLIQLFQLTEVLLLRNISQCVVLSSFNPLVIQRMLIILGITNAQSISDKETLPILSRVVYLLLEQNKKRHEICLPEHFYLTLREIKILWKTLLGISVNDMAYHERIKPKRIYDHRTRALKKCGVRDTLSLLRSLNSAAHFSDWRANGC